MFRNAIYRRLVGEETEGVITHPDGVGEEVALEFIHEGVADYPAVLLDLNALTQNTTIRLYVKVDGTNYRLVTPAVFPGDFPANAKVVPIVLYPTGKDWVITLQSGIAEGADRSIPYVFVKRSFA